MSIDTTPEVCMTLPEPWVIGQVPAELIEAVPEGNTYNRLLKTRQHELVEIGRYMADCAQEIGIRAARPREVWTAQSKLEPGKRDHYNFHSDAPINLVSTSWGADNKLCYGNIFRSRSADCHG